MLILDSWAEDGGFGIAGRSFGAGGRMIGVLSAVQLAKDSNKDTATRGWCIDLGNICLPPLDRHR